MLRASLLWKIAGVTLVGLTVSFAQASKQLEKRTKDLQNTQQKSWEQVDKINKEADGTKSRYQQSREASGLNKQKKGYDVTKHGIVPSNRSWKSKDKTRKAEAKKK